MNIITPNNELIEKLIEVTKELELVISILKQRKRWGITIKDTVFKQEIKHLGCEFKENTHSYCILKDNELAIKIDKHNNYQIDGYTAVLGIMTKNDMNELFELVFDFTSALRENRI